MAEVSVIIPCYNYARFLPDAVASVVAQTFTDWEIIIVDDGSRDDTIQVAQQVRAQFAERRIRLLHQPNRGLSAARNTGARYAAGDLLLFLDADDLLDPAMLARTTAVLRQHPDVGFVYTGMRLFGHDWHYWPGVPFDLRALLLDNFVPPHALLRRVVWQEAGGFDAVRFAHGFEDWDFWLRAVAAGWRGYHIADPLIFYRRHGNSMSNRFTPACEWDARAQIIRKHPGLYGPRLAAWATVRLARRGQPPAAAQPRGEEGATCEIAPPAAGSGAGGASRLVWPAGPDRPVPLARRLVRAVPFGLRFRVKCWLRHAQLWLRATGFVP